MKLGIDVLAATQKYDSLFKNRRVGLLTNHTGLDSCFRSSIDIIKSKYNLTALFGPEHGVRGDLAPGAVVDSFTDTATGLPVYSLYRKDSKRFSQSMLDEFDVLIYDIQDVGSRFYTYIYSMVYALEDCAKANKSFVVLDRPNPLGGIEVEGNILRDEYRSFIGDYPLCMRYGLTVGELAIMVKTQQKINVDLTVIKCEGYIRQMIWTDTGLSWVMPSPNLPRFEAALLYSGTCLFEGTNLSEGRGTAAPFEIIGAPYIKNPDKLAQDMNDKNLSGVVFRPIYFTPTTQKNKDELCGGVQIHVTNSTIVRPVKTALELLYEIANRYKNSFQWRTVLPPATRHSILLLGGDNLIYNQKPISEVLQGYSQDEKIFAEIKKSYHIYK